VGYWQHTTKTIMGKIKFVIIVSCEYGYSGYTETVSSTSVMATAVFFELLL